MIKTVIFDIGKVLMKFEWNEMLTEQYGEEKTSVLNDAFWNHGYWDELDRGVMPVNEIIDGFVKCAPQYEEEIRYNFDHIDQCMFPHDYAIDWVKELKEKGYQVLFLSNYSHYLMDKKPEVLNFIPYMDGGVFSCDVNLIKPDKAIYQLICDKYSFKKEEAIFIDDNPNNFKSANEFGLKTFLFEGYEKTYPVVMDYLKNH